ncbi:MAG: phosphatidylserine decarboxylase [Phycisphaerales bacterium]|jgi:phosphatidylserine decarboxylase|nr:phosphatidylserine decarboxylase [Phycisphaerales bacterium]
MKIAKEGWPFVLIFALATAILGWLALRYLGVGGYAVLGLGVVLTLWCLWFFRDPERTPPSVRGGVISPADGVVCAIGPAELPVELGLSEGSRTRVCVFMNVFNVHVNRVPASGRIIKLAYTKGKFFNASLDKASVHNERMAVAMRSDAGDVIGFVQIAGLVARRIVCKLRDNQAVKQGERFGLIRFGSRVDVYLPPDAEVMVTLGQKTTAGETVLATIPARPEAQGLEVKDQGVPVGR